MASHVCCIVPPHLLQAIIDSEDTGCTDEHKEAARASLAAQDRYISERAGRFAALSQPHGRQLHHQNHRHAIVPEHLLKSVLESPDVDQETKARAERGLAQIHKLAEARQSGQQDVTIAAAELSDPGFYRGVYDAQHVSDEAKLPGKTLRLEGQHASKDQAANEAYDNVGKVLDFYLDVFNWKSIDNQNMHVISSVHFSRNFENAFWDPQKMQMVFGDGHNFLFHFTKCLDVIGHELTHAVTEHTSPLVYESQSGALNEHVSDVFGIMIKQKAENETAEEADWLIGEGCLLPGVKGVALRSMKAPGTAYNDPRFGKDPQPADMSGFQETSADNGGVHIFSGIPNRAFYLASVGFGGYSWEKAGQVWWKTMNSGRVSPMCNFLQFADVTVEVAQELYGDEGAKIVRDAWNTVGVVRTI